jgi:tetratricopeptide (TPR) repeat protein
MSSSASDADPLAQLADDFLRRHRRGERPALTEYTERHPELAEQIRELFPGLVLLEEVRPQPAPTVRGAAAEVAAEPCRLGEYRIVREIGRGGMGVVYEAEQVSLGRRVALKVLPPGALGDARHVERFQREAKAAARLHHSNIVPVFAVGVEGGTHYYVMQYIEGQPLDDVLTELRRLRAEADDRALPPTEKGPGAAEVPPGAGPAAADELCGASVAQSLWQGQFRPARPLEEGVAEPAPAAPNTNLPPTGAAAVAEEATSPPGSGTGSSSGPLSDPQRPFVKSVAQLGVQVAEALEYAAGQGVLHRDVKPSNLLLDVWGTVWLTDFGLAKASGTPDLTRTGDLLGTIRYMAPERFRGEADVRSDVYALGLTLYEILALRPAFGGHDQAELVRHITTAQAPRLERIDRRLPRDLVTIVHKAMAREPGDRYQTPAALADDLRRFLDDRSILARRASVVEQAWRWCRRNPPKVALLAALLALLLLASGGGVWLLWERAQRRAEAARQEKELRKEVGTALAQAVRFRQAFHFRAARELLEQTRERLEPAGPDDLRQRLDQARADLDLAEQLDAARLHAATLVEGKYDFPGAERRYAAAFAEAGLGREGDAIPALAARVRDSAVRAEIVGALDDWASLTTVPARREWLLAVARGVDPHPRRDRLRQPKLWRDGVRLKRLTQEVRGAELSSQLAAALGRALRASGGEGAPLLATVQAHFPNDFWLNFLLGGTFARAERWDESLGFYRAALALRPETVAVHFSLGDALRAKGRPGEAIGHYRRALQLDPRSAAIHISLGHALYDQGQRDEASDHYREALRLDPESANAHNNLGIALYHKGRRDEAIDHFQRALRLDPEHAPAHSNLGNALRDKGRLEEAIDHFQRALRLDPKLAQAHSNLGNALQAKGRLNEAINHYWQALRLDPKLVQAHYNLGIAMIAQGRRDEAIDHFQRALRLDPEHAPAHSNLGNALRDKGRLEEAIDHFQRALRLDPKLALAHHNLGNALQAKGRLNEAINHYWQAVRLDPKLVQAHYNLGTVLIDQGRLDQAIDHLRLVLRLDPEHAEAHCNLGHALQRQGHFAEALACLKRGHELGSKNPRWPYPSGQWLQQAQRLAALENKLPAVLQGKHQPANAAEGVLFAHLCRAQKRYAAAARLQANALTADPTLATDLQAGHRYKAACFAALAAVGQGQDAGTLGPMQRLALRRQALTWLRAELRAWCRAADAAEGGSIRLAHTLAHWQKGPDLAGLRDADALGRLYAEERQACENLWANVAALLRQAQGK